MRAYSECSNTLKQFRVAFPPWRGLSVSLSRRPYPSSQRSLALVIARLKFGVVASQGAMQKEKTVLTFSTHWPLRQNHSSRAPQKVDAENE
jgi:hypothetical protein